MTEADMPVVFSPDINNHAPLFPETPVKMDGLDFAVMVYFLK